MMQQSETIANLAVALSKAQAEIEGASKSSVNPHFKNRYADLSAVWEACRVALTANGLSVVQFPGEMIDNRMTLTTQLTHASGEWMRDTLSIPLGKVDAQGYGSATTYARRYALAAVVGVCPEDDDGNAASRTRNDNAQEPRITAQQCAELRGLIGDASTSEEALCSHLRCNTLPELPASRFADAKAALSGRIKTMKKEAA